MKIYFNTNVYFKKNLLKNHFPGYKKQRTVVNNRFTKLNNTLK